VVNQRQLQKLCSEIVRLLREERERQGLAMLTVAERAGLSQQMVSYVEREMRRPTLDTVLRIALALEVDLGDVIKQAATKSTKTKGGSRQTSADPNS
jgi:transcriptional regulator with XRE-family HTH domain